MKRPFILTASLAIGLCSPAFIAAAVEQYAVPGGLLGLGCVASATVLLMRCARDNHWS